MKKKKPKLDAVSRVGHGVVHGNRIENEHTYLVVTTKGEPAPYYLHDSIPHRAQSRTYARASSWPASRRHAGNGGGDDDEVDVHSGDGAGRARVRHLRVQPAQGHGRRQVPPIRHLLRRRPRLGHPLLPRHPPRPPGRRRRRHRRPRRPGVRLRLSRADERGRHGAGVLRPRPGGPRHGAAGDGARHGGAPGVHVRRAEHVLPGGGLHGPRRARGVAVPRGRPPHHPLRRHRHQGAAGVSLRCRRARVRPPDVAGRHGELLAAAEEDAGDVALVRGGEVSRAHAKGTGRR
jgi:hypothetical protein